VMSFIGHMGPAVADQRIRVDLTDPAHRMRFAMTKTDSSGVFRAHFDLLTPPNGPGKIKARGKEKPLPGQYTCVAQVLDATTTADATSNTVTVER
jgi:hypothetical protein